MSETCHPQHDWFTDVLSAGLCIGLVISYLPQHYRIIATKSSEGFSPWYLLLGSTSSASGMLNMIVMQWGIIKCCRVVSAGSCLEMTGGVIQVSLQWLMFTVVLVLYMMYFPPHLKYAEIDVDTHDMRPPQHIKTQIKSDDWRLSITLSWVVFIHILLITFVTIFLLATTTSGPQTEQIASWATFLGVTSAGLAAVQYTPQLVHTYHTRLVGALSIPMMVLQSPGSALMVISIALRPDTNWTSWITFAVSGIMQGSLLIMCIVWKYRQRRLGIDDFGQPLVNSESPETLSMEGAVESAVDSDVRSGITFSTGDDSMDAVEDTPLLAKDPQRKRKGGLFRRLAARVRL